MTNESDQSTARVAIKALEDRIHVLKSKDMTMSSQVARLEKAGKELSLEEDFVAANAVLRRCVKAREKQITLKYNILECNLHMLGILRGSDPQRNGEAGQPSVAHGTAKK